MVVRDTDQASRTTAVSGGGGGGVWGGGAQALSPTWQAAPAGCPPPPRWKAFSPFPAGEGGPSGGRQRMGWRVAASSPGPAVNFAFGGVRLELAPAPICWAGY